MFATEGKGVVTYYALMLTDSDLSVENCHGALLALGSVRTREGRAGARNGRDDAPSQHAACTGPPSLRLASPDSKNGGVAEVDSQPHMWA